MKKFYIADWHYGHKNAIAYDNRPFTSVDEMNKELIKRWNDAVSNEDVVYVLGDMFWCQEQESIEVLDGLNGIKFLVRGNHDKRNQKLESKFSKVADYMEVRDGDKHIVLCHYPMPCFKNHYYGWYHLYGHVHSSFEYNMMENTKMQMSALYDTPCKMYNVGVMMPYMNYTPRTLEEIVKGG